MSGEATGTATAPRIGDGESAADILPASQRTEGVRHTDITGSGRREQLTVPNALRGQLAQRMQSRLDYANESAVNQDRLSVYDRMIRAKGEELVDKISSDQAFTKDETILLWAVVNDDLLLKEGAAGSTRAPAAWRQQISARMQERIGAIDRSGMPTPMKLGLRATARSIAGVREGVGTAVGRRRTEERASSTTELTSEYLTRIGFLDWDPRQVATDIEQLHRLRTTLEKNLGIPNLDSDTWDRPDFSRGRGPHLLFTSVAERQRAIIRREFNGTVTSFAELQRVDPAAAERVRHMAVQETLKQSADSLARGTLLTDGPGDQAVSKIEAAMGRIGNPPTGEAKIRADRTLQGAKATWEGLATRLEQLNGTVTENGSILNMESTLREAQAVLTATQQRIADLQQTFAQGNPNSPINTSIQGNINTLTSQERENLATVARMTQSINDAQAEVTRITATAQQNNPPPLGSLQAVEAQVTAAESAAHGTANVLERTTRKSLESWKDAASSENYTQVINSLFTQGFEGGFSRRDLGNADLTPEGQLTGAENIRHLIFGQSGTNQRRMVSDEAIARGIIHIFRVDTRQIYPGQNDSIDTLIGNLTQPRTALVQAENNLRTGQGTQQAYEQALTALQNAQRNLLTPLITMMSEATTMDNADVVRFVMEKGIASAEKGRPNLEVEERYLHQEPELRDTAKGISRQDMGTITDIREAGRFRGPQITWEGKLNKIEHGQDSFFEGFDIDDERTQFNFRITTTFSGSNQDIVRTIPRDEANCRMQVEVNESFLQSLPNNPPENWPPDLVRRFYDRFGRPRQQVGILRPAGIRTRAQRVFRHMPRWVDIPLQYEVDEQGVGGLAVPPPLAPENGISVRLNGRQYGRVIGNEAALPVDPDIPDALDPLNNAIAANASANIEVALANTFIYNRRPQDRSRGAGMALSEAERRLVIGGFRDVEVNYGNNRMLIISMDDAGEFFIRDGAGQLREETLTAFLDQQQREYTEAAANPNNQAAIQGRMQVILQGVGQEILRTQIRR